MNASQVCAATPWKKVPRRVRCADSRNPLGLNGVEYMEYATSDPNAFDSVLRKIGFAPVSRHRSKEVVLYRQGAMNLIVNAHPVPLPGMSAPRRSPALSAIAFRVRDAEHAWRRALDLGVWEIPSRTSAMELNIPGIRGAGDSILYFVDRYRDFSIYEVDFIPLPGAGRPPPALAGMDYWGVVQAVPERQQAAWMDFYRLLLGFRADPAPEAGSAAVMRSPCGRFQVQMVGARERDESATDSEPPLRLVLGVPDLRAAVAAWKSRGMSFGRARSKAPDAHRETRPVLGALTFELIQTS